jgi:hypothetical protein
VPILSQSSSNNVIVTTQTTGYVVTKLPPNISYTTPQPITIDWSCKASSVINQGKCGACFIIAPL